MKSSVSLGVAGGRFVRTVASIAAALVAVTALIELTRAQATAPKPTMPIKQLMETVITDTSNAIWAASDPPTSGEQWTALEQAALKLVDAAKVTAVGGTGPMDNEWTKQPAWQPFNAAMLAAERSGAGRDSSEGSRRAADGQRRALSALRRLPPGVQPGRREPKLIGADAELTPSSGARFNRSEPALGEVRHGSARGTGRGRIMVAAMPALAHRSNSAYQVDQIITLSGTVKEWRWMNPHTWLYITVKGPDGKEQEWAVEGRPPGILGRAGWSSTILEPGETVTVRASPAKNGDPEGIIARVTKADGTVLGNAPNYNREAPAAARPATPAPAGAGARPSFAGVYYPRKRAAARRRPPSTR